MLNRKLITKTIQKKEIVGLLSEQSVVFLSALKGKRIQAGKESPVYFLYRALLFCTLSDVESFFRFTFHELCLFGMLITIWNFLNQATTVADFFRFGLMF
jgi:hypothetical protein